MLIPDFQKAETGDTDFVTQWEPKMIGRKEQSKMKINFQMIGWKERSNGNK
jgi:hypothetical protein